METAEAVSILTALGQNTRLETFRALVAHEPEGLAAGEIARLSGVPQNTMSAHLAALARAGLVRGERQSRSIIYRANLETVRALTLYLIRDCCGGAPELCTPIVAELAPRCETTGPAKEENCGC